MSTETNPGSVAATAAVSTSPAAEAAKAAMPAANTIEHYAELARRSIMREGDQPAATPDSAVAKPAVEAELKPAEEGQAASTESAAEELPAAEGEPSVAESTPAEEQPGSDADEAEPTADEQANWSEGEKRLYKALKRERADRKEAKKQTAELKSVVDQLQAKLATPPVGDPSKPATGADGDRQQAQTSTAAPVVAGLAACQDLASVDALVTQASSTETAAFTLLNKVDSDRAGVDKTLQQHRVTHIGGVPVAEASNEQVRDYLTSAYTGARETVVQADTRRAFIRNRETNWMQAASVMPQINDVKSPEFAAIAGILKSPELRNRVDGPIQAVRLLLGDRAMTQTLLASAKPAAKPKAAVVKAAPGAPRTSVAALPQQTEATAIADRVAKGTATLEDMKKYARALVKA